jgi:Zn-dependent peptidase ImmA (M78 family)
MTNPQPSPSLAPDMVDPVSAAYSMVMNGSLSAFADKVSPQLNEVAAALEVEVIASKFPDDVGDRFAGFLLPRARDGKSRIVINADLPGEEQIEALAHELSHVVLHRDLFVAMSDVDDSLALMQVRHDITHLAPEVQAELNKMKRSQLEREADAFARLLLLPTKTFTALKAKDWDNPRIAEALSIPVWLVEERAGDADVQQQAA